MKIYFDESGNTGCILPNKNGDLYNDNQHFFVLAGVITYGEEDEKFLRQKYADFLSKFKSDGKELKGSDLLTRKNNDALLYFIENLLDTEHFYICCYDKIFYLATLISEHFIGLEMRNEHPLLYYRLASALSREDITLFETYCQAIGNNSKDNRKSFADYILRFPYQKIDDCINLYKLSAKQMLDDNNFPPFLLPKGCYIKEDITNLINLTALGETLLVLKNHPHSVDGIQVIHDHITEYEPEFFDTLQSQKDIELSFADSSDELLLQYADNVASIFRKFYTETIMLFLNGQQWDMEKSWFPTNLAAFFKKVKTENIKFVTTISDWALSFCIPFLFDKRMPISKRTDQFFIPLFNFYKEKIEQLIACSDYSIDL